MRVYIPTYGRAHRLRTVDYLPKLRSRITLVVRPEEVHEYGPLGYDMAVLSKKVKDIAATRHAVGEIAGERGEKFFAMADDDLRVLQRDDQLKLTPLQDGRELMRVMKKLLATQYAQVALSPRFMNNTVPEPVVPLKPQSQFTAYRTEDYRLLKFGEAKYFEDVHRTLQLLTAGKPTAMIYDYAIDIGPMNTDGGMADWRNYDDMMAEAFWMERRWPGIVRACEVRDEKFWPGQPNVLRPHIRMQWKKAYKG
jgi:hypothetical protein